MCLQGFKLGVLRMKNKNKFHWYGLEYVFARFMLLGILRTEKKNNLHWYGPKDMLENLSLLS